jgi:CxxC motif-containing protein (DUF1111 family)
MKRLHFAPGALLVLSAGLMVLSPSGYPPRSYSMDTQRGDGEEAPGDRQIREPAEEPAEAPTGFDGLTNGLLTQDEFNEALRAFEEREGVEEGLGPVYNAQSCVECHQNPLAGGISQVVEIRAGHRASHGGRRGRHENARFEAASGGSLIQDRAINAAIQERVPESEDIRTFRTSLNTLGDGFVEAIPDETLLRIAREQAHRSDGRIRGEAVWVPVLEADNALRIGRFGWKDQHASLLSFAADAYLNEMGITSPLQPAENSSLGRPVAAFDTVNDPENDGEDTDAFAAFMRATKAPPRDEELAATPEAVAGRKSFEAIGCASCHVTTIVTAPADQKINGGTFVVPPALGNKVIHPFGDFLLHDVGTGDGIVQNGGAGTANKLRTPPLWGVRTRTRFMHDGQSLTFEEAILRHGGEAEHVTARFRRLDERQQRNLIEFLKSL